MIDIKTMLENEQYYRKQYTLKGYEIPFDKLRNLYSEKKVLAQEVDSLRNHLKINSKKVAEALKNSEKTSLSEESRSDMANVNEKISKLNSKIKLIDDSISEIMLMMPNMPAERVAPGKSSLDNIVVKHWGQSRDFAFLPKTHDILMEKMGIFETVRAAKLSGSRFSTLIGAASRLEKGLSKFLFDTAVDNGYIPISVPFLVRENIMVGTGQLPKFEDDMFRVLSDDKVWYLIPTAEVPLTNIHADEIIQQNDLPLCYCSLTPSFRAEAGSGGRDIKGLIRQHQFEKLELVKFVEPSSAWEELDKLLLDAESTLQKLGLHYRVIELCGGDLGFTSSFTYDIEVWLPGQNAYREVSSCSNYGDYQARRARIRYKNRDGKNQLLHTLNGSAMPVGRTLAAVIEQYQREDGSVEIPPILVPYVGFRVINQDGSVE